MKSIEPIRSYTPKRVKVGTIVCDYHNIGASQLLIHNLHLFNTATTSRLNSGDDEEEEERKKKETDILYLYLEEVSTMVNPEVSTYEREGGIYSDGKVECSNMITSYHDFGCCKQSGSMSTYWNPHPLR
jgi:hypothetical protein